jgi:DNA-directed RNA polymerase specialized sigma24 family protein
MKHPIVQSGKLGELDERQLVALAKAGHEGAFEQLVTRTRDQCFRTTMCILGDREDASDVVQIAFWKASRTCAASPRSQSSPLGSRRSL